MSRAVEQRVVQMVFDNEAFQRGIRATIESLSHLDKALQLDGASSGLAAAQKAINGLDTSGIASEASLAERAFDSFGRVATNVLDSISTAAKVVSVSLGVITAGLGAKALGQIISGGNRRAANIENAKFTLSGLGVDWKDIEPQIDYAVKDTAFGLDEAAVAASMFVASGVDVGEDMKVALRSISGVAALTNSEYSDIANIFTAAAGQGYVMGDQLTRLAYRGMNAKAALADFFNEVNSGIDGLPEDVRDAVYDITGGIDVTEDKIRELASQGEISFQLFAYAMDYEFGEHAKQANETFNGALANMNAALSRIGADFITPIREGSRRVFLSLKDLFNNVRSGLRDVEAEFYIGGGMWQKGSIVDQFTISAIRAADGISTAFNQITSSGAVHDFIVATAPLVIASFDAISQGIASFTRWLPDLFHYMEPDFEWLSEIMKSLAVHVRDFGVAVAVGLRPVMETLGHLIASFMNLIKAGISVVYPIISAFLDSLSGKQVYDAAMGIAQMSASVEDFTKSLVLSPEAMGQVHDFFYEIFRVVGQFAAIPFSLIQRGIGGISAAFGYIASIAGPVLDALTAPVFDTVLPALGSVFQSMADGLESLAASAGDFIASNFPKALEYVGEIASWVGEKIADLVRVIVDFVSENVDFEAIWGSISAAFSAIADSVANMDLGPIGEFIESLRDGTVVLPSFREMLDLLADAFIRGMSAIGGAAEFIGSGLSELLTALLGFVGLDPEDVVESAKSLGESLLAIKDGSSDFLSGNILETVKEKIREFVEGVKELFSSFDPGRLWNDIILGAFTGFGLRFMTVILNIIENFSAGKNTLGGALQGLLDSLSGFLGGLEKTLKFVKIELIADSLLKIAAAIGILALAVGLFTLLDSEKLAVATEAIVAIILAVTVLATWLGAISETAKPQALMALSGAFAGIGLALGGLSLALLGFAAAVKILSTVDPAMIAVATVAIAGFVFVLSTTLGAVAKVAGPELLKLGGGMVLVAIGLGLLVGAMIGLTLIPYEALINGLSALVIVLLALSGGVSLLKFAGIDKAASGLIVFAVALAILTPAIIALGQAGAASYAGVGAVALLMVALGALMFALTLFVDLVDSKTLLLGATSMLIVAGALVVVAAAVSMLSSFGGDLGRIVAVTAVLGALMIMLGAAAYIAKDAFSGATAILTLAVAMGVLGATLVVLGLVPWDVLSQGLMAFFLALVMIGAAIAVVDHFAQGAFWLSVVVLSMAAAFLVGAVGIGVLAFNLSMLALALPGVQDAFAEVFGEDMLTALANILGVTAGALLLAVAITAVGVASLLVLPSLLALAVILPILSDLMGSDFVSGADDAKAKIEALGEVLGSFADMLKENAPKYAEAGVALFGAFVTGVFELTPTLADAGLTAVEHFLEAVDNHLDPIMTRGMSILLKLMNGIEQGLPIFLIAASNLMTSFISALAQGITDNRQRVLAVMAQLGAAIITALMDTLADGVAAIVGEDNPVVQAMRDSAASVRDAADEMAEEANEAYRKRMNDRGMPATTEECIAEIQKVALENIPELKGLGKELGDVLSGNFGIGLSDLPSLTDEQLDQVQKVINDAGLDVDIRAVAEAIPPEFASGIDGMSIAAAQEMEEVDRAIDGAGDGAYGKGEETGSDYAAGLKAGLLSAGLMDVAASIANGINSQFRLSFLVRSPSKVAYQIGAFYSEGLALGISDMGETAIRSAEDTAFGVIGATAGLAAQIAAEMDAIQAAPTVTPVLDTSSVTEGMALLDAMMMQRQIAMAGWAGAQSYYDPVASSRVDNQPQTVYNTYLDYDAGSDATDMVRDMTRKFKMANALGG